MIVPVCLYQDDHCLICLPHESGRQIMDIIMRRLSLTVEKAAQSVRDYQVTQRGREPDYVVAGGTDLHWL